MKTVSKNESCCSSEGREGGREGQARTVCARSACAWTHVCSTCMCLDCVCSTCMCLGCVCSDPLVLYMCARTHVCSTCVCSDRVCSDPPVLDVHVLGLRVLGPTCARTHVCPDRPREQGSACQQGTWGDWPAGVWREERIGERDAETGLGREWPGGPLGVSFWGADAPRW